MDLKQLFKDEDAVSPVIGVILMVAITVILAAVIASFVLGLGNQTDTGAPTTTIGFEYDQVEEANSGTEKAWGVLEVSHNGGDSVSNQEIYIRGSGFNASGEHCDGSAADDADDWASTGSGTQCYSSAPGLSSGNTMQDYTDDTIHRSTSGKWPASQTSGSDSQIVSGDYVNVYVSEDYEVSVVYQSQEGDTSSTLNEDSGPDA